MERQIKPLPKKPWTELTQEVQQVIRKSWKHHLPEVFDVFCIGDLRIDVFTKIPGNLYVSGNADIGDVNVGGDIIVDGDAYIDGMDVGGNFIVEGNAFTGDVNVGGDFIVGGDAYTEDMDVGGNFIVEGNAFTGDVNVGGDFIVGGKAYIFCVQIDGLFDCYDVNTHEYPIHAADFVCRCYEEKNA